jgi:menaquinone-9 beta-reductase
MLDVLIIGGGLAGLVNAILINRAGLKVTLAERHHYPFHRVCGEYVSLEVLPFLQANGLFPGHLDPPYIRRFLLTSTRGRTAEALLDQGGFGLSRYAFDNHLYRIALQEGVQFQLGIQAQGISCENDRFRVELSDHSAPEARLVIGAHGKRSRLDTALQRRFMERRSGYIGVKYHVRTDFPADSIALHNFEGGYCGLSRVENGIYNLCYLGSRAQLRQYGTISAMEEQVLRKNPFLRSVFENSDFLFDKPLVINEFSFHPKAPVEKHLLMSGDAAGLITPLCGNGMAMAIHSAAILSPLIAAWFRSPNRRLRDLEIAYSTAWRKAFARRLWVGRRIQSLFGGEMASGLAVDLLRYSPALAQRIIRSTHGRPF